VRVVAATNRSPEQAVRDGRLREDLYYRLSVFPIELPPLRERGDDLAMLAGRFLDGLNREYGKDKRFAPQALQTMAEYAWPGNVRELKNFVRRAFILAESDTLDASALTPQISPSDAAGGGQVIVPVGSTLAEADRRLILATLQRCGGVKKQTAAMLGISAKTLYNRLEEYGEAGPPDAAANEEGAAPRAQH